MPGLELVRAEMEAYADAEKAAHASRFFKTGKGQYGEGDIFRGIRVPVLRTLSKKYWKLPLETLEELLTSAFHEDRLLALLCLVRRFQKGNDEEQAAIYQAYLRRLEFVNNWDLVDSSAEHIIGAFLCHRARSKIHDLAVSPVLWERRIAMLSTFHFIKKGDFDDALRVAEILLRDREVLIHKAVGWMLREIGSLDMGVEEAFLRKHHLEMPRTTLRYAIEKFPEDVRLGYLRGNPPHARGGGHVR